MQNNIKKALLLTLFSGTTSLSALSSTWILPGNGDWSVGGNWSAGVPSSSGDTATLTTVAASPTVTLSVPITITDLVFSGTSDYTLTGSALTLDSFLSPSITASGSGAYTISNNLVASTFGLPIVINHTGTGSLAISGNISESILAGITYTGPGTLILSGNNSAILGSCTYNSGTIEINSGNSLPSPAAGTFLNAATIHTTGTFSSPNPFTWLLGSASSTFDTDTGTTFSFGGILTGTGTLNKQGGGTLKLTFPANLPAATNVLAGTLEVDSNVYTSGGGLSISPGATFRMTNTGSATLTGTVTNNGSFSIAETFGPSVISGGYTQSSTGTMTVNVASAGLVGQFSQYFFTGAAALDGNLVIAPTTTVTGGGDLTFLQASGGVTGQFSNVTISPPTIVVNSITYNPGSVVISVLPGLSPVQTNTIQTIKNTEQTVKFQNFLQYQQYQQNLHRRIWKEQDATKAAKPATTASLSKKNGGKQRLLAANDRFGYSGSNYGFTTRPTRSGRSNLIAEGEGSSDPGMIDQASIDSAGGDNENLTREQLEQKIQSLETAIQQQEEQGNPTPHHFYAGPSYTMTASGPSNTWSSGLTTGYDYAFPTAGLGGTFNYDHSSGSGFATDTVSLTAYSSYVPPSFPQVSLSYSAGYNYTLLFTYSKKGNPGELKMAKARQNSQGYSGNLGFEFTLDSSLNKKMPEGLSLSPNLSFSYSYSSSDTYEEHGSGEFDLQFKGDNSQNVVGVLQTTLVYSKSWDDFSFLQSYTIGWSRTLTNHANVTSFRPAGVKMDYIDSVGPDSHPNSASASIDYQFSFYNIYSIETSWSFDYNQGYHSNRFYIAGHFRF